MAKEMIRGAGKTCISFHNSCLSQHVLEGKHPSSRFIRYILYKKLSVEKRRQSSLTPKRNNNNILAFGNAGSIVQGCFNMLFGEHWKIIFDDFLLRNASAKQFENLPEHDSCSFESRGSSANLAVSDNVLVDFNSHEIDSGYPVFKDFVSQLRSGFSELQVWNFRIESAFDWVNNFRAGKIGFWNWIVEKRLKIDCFE